MPKYKIPTEELKIYVDPRDGAMWRCKPIEQREIDAALSSKVQEERRWDDLVNTLGQEEARSFHINRIATFVRNPPLGDIVLILVNHEENVRAYLNDGNHRLAAAYIRGDSHVIAIVAASKIESIHDVFPGAALT